MCLRKAFSNFFIEVELICNILFEVYNMVIKYFL